MSYILSLTFIGILTGLAAGVIGAGTEIMIVPLLTFFGVFSSLKHRIGTSLVMLLPPIGIMAAYKFYQKGYVHVREGLYMATLFAVAAYVSSRYSVQMDEDLIRKIFAVLVILAGCYMLFSTTP